MSQHWICSKCGIDGVFTGRPNNFFPEESAELCAFVMMTKVHNE